MRDVVDRCRVWESHADPEVRPISKPSPDPIYPAYVVDDSDNISEMDGGGYQAEVWSGSAGGHASTFAGGHSYPGSNLSPGSGGAGGGEITAASGGGDTESSTAGRGFT